jgi:hypothetical protein
MAIARIRMVPRPKTIRRIVTVVVVTKIIMPVCGPNPKMKKRPGNVDDHAGPVVVTSTISYVAVNITRSVERTPIVPTIIPIARYKMTTVGDRQIVVRDPNPVGVTGRPKSRAPHIAAFTVLPTSRYPKDVIRNRLARRPLFQRRGWQRKWIVGYSAIDSPSPGHPPMAPFDFVPLAR